VAFAGPRFVSAPVVIGQPVYFVDPCFPISLAVTARRPAFNGADTGYGQSAPGGAEVIPAPRAVPKDGTFQYDGGPANPVPMPKAEPAPNRAAPRTIVPEGRVVSFESKAPKYSYSAYGEKPASRQASDRQLAAKPAK
jgi:hypothetical protein